jgi:YidC/Oxa1 family membrane protein insertase
MTPLQIKQQKFSKLNSIIMPEIKKIQNKYKGKKDQKSQMKMQEEISAVHEKYGVSQAGSCAQLLIQMPIMLALYQVIYRIPGYVVSVGSIFNGLIKNIIGVSGYTGIIETFIKDEKMSTVKLIMDGKVATKESIIDFLYKLSPAQWDKFSDLSKFSGFSDVIDSTSSKIANIGDFLGMNISDTPFSIVKSGWANKSYLLIFGAILIPFLAWFTQWMNYKLMPQPSTGSGETGTMENSMKSMNMVMPLMSAVFCVSFPVGVGIYWIAGAVVRSVQQLIINKHLEKVDIDELIRHNQDKAMKKRAKKGLPPQKITQQASVNTRSVGSDKSSVSSEEKEEAIKKATEYYNSGNMKQGSIASRANMVKQFDEKNKKK